MESLSKNLARELKDIVGSKWVLTDRDRLLAYESDGLTAYRSMPLAVVLPESTSQVSNVFKLLAQNGIKVVPRGAGTGLSGGALAEPTSVIIGTSRMNTILELDADNRRAVVQPGVITAHLSEAAAPFGLYYAPDPASQSACTIGGNVAENSGGPHCLKYGVPSRYVTGLTIVTYEGEILQLGGVGQERGSYDLVGVFVGSEGCFGMATEVEVKLLPIP